MDKEVSLQGFPPGNDLKQLLIACAKALSDNKMDDFDKLIEKARDAVYVRGEPMQRLGAYMIQGLLARKLSKGTDIYRVLKTIKPKSEILLFHMQSLYEICPYLKFCYWAAKGAIAEAMNNEDHIHIIDFKIGQGTQWISLLEKLAARPGGAPHVRITGIDDLVSEYARGEGLGVVGRHFATFSEKFNIPIEFNGVPDFAQNVTRDMLHVRPGEALAVNLAMLLHLIPDESVDVNNPRDGILRMVKSLSPKVVTLIEQESNTNTTSFYHRFVESLEYYLAMFKSIDDTMKYRSSNDRMNMERHILAMDMVNVIACEGNERVKRHELFNKWKFRLTSAGFSQYPLSTFVNFEIKRELGSHSKHHTLVEKDGALILGWKGRNLISASAWH
uniref:Uncharacterized protein n=1 Tax=Fagus sylvatica TaxID=28930 RepID=A0A2N9H5F1_FAGSY